MCKAPKPPEIKEPKKPQFLRNKYLDEFVGDAQAVKSMKQGRSALRIDQRPSGVGGRDPADALGLDNSLPDISPTAPAAAPAAIAPRSRLQTAGLKAASFALR